MGGKEKTYLHTQLCFFPHLRKHDPLKFSFLPLFQRSANSPYFSLQIISSFNKYSKLSYFQSLKIFGSVLNHFASARMEGIFKANIQAEGREPWVLGCPWVPLQNLGFSRVPGPDFRAWAPSHTLPSGHFWVGLETPKIIVFQAHPGPLELRIMAFLAPLLVPFLGLRRGPSKPLFWGLPGRLSKLSQGALSGPLRGSLIALK